MQKSIALALALCGVSTAVASPALAALHDRGNGLIYDDVLDVTWMQHADYSHTRVGWNAAKDWAASLEYGGYDDWRLPRVRPVALEWNYVYGFNGTTDVGYNITSPNSELSYMFYVNLGNVGRYDTAGSETGCGSLPAPKCLTNTSFTDGTTGLTVSFLELEPTAYWSGTSYDENPSIDAAFAFSMEAGQQHQNGIGVARNLWAVRDGDVLADPAPVPALHPVLLASALVLTGLAAAQRRRGRVEQRARHEAGR